MNRYLFLAFFLGFLSSYLWVMWPAEANFIANAYEKQPAPTQTSGICPGNSKMFGFLIPSSAGQGGGSIICNYDLK